MLTSLVILTVTFFGLTLYSVVQANMALFHIEASRLLSLKIFDTSSAATLFVTLLGALLLRHQFALGLLPRINYKSKATTKQNLQTPNESFETWRVDIRNTGLGSAIVNGTEYLLETDRAKNSFHFHKSDGIVKAFAKINLILDRDYWLGNITEGFSLSPKDDCFVFEIKTEHLKQLKRLDMVLYFQGQLGDKYRREIFLIPRL